MRIIDFADGYSSSAAPNQGTVTASALQSFANDAAYVTWLTGIGGTLAAGFAYLNSTDSTIHSYDGAAWHSSGGTGTVTSVGVSVPSILSVSGSPVTSSGTIALTLASQAANTVLAAPNGSAGTPTFRALVGADLPAPSSSTLGGVKSIAGVSHQWVNSISTAGAPSLSQPAFSDLSGTIAKTQCTAPTVQKFTTGSGTYTTPTSPAPLYIRVRMVGGGGGGGGGGASGGGSGTGGGNTTFGTTLLVANGGGGGSPGSVNGGPGTGGTTSLGTGPIGLALSGATGGCGGAFINATGTMVGPSGGASAFGGSGSSTYSGAAGAGVANTGGGGGGGGCSETAGTNGQMGGGGGAGGFVDAIITSPAATYAYAVGAGGSLGAAASGGFAGGAGGAGVIIVEEYYQ